MKPISTNDYLTTLKKRLSDYMREFGEIFPRYEQLENEQKAIYNMPEGGDKQKTLLEKNEEELQPVRIRYEELKDFIPDTIESILNHKVHEKGPSKHKAEELNIKVFNEVLLNSTTYLDKSKLKYILNHSIAHDKALNSIKKSDVLIQNDDAGQKICEALFGITKNQFNVEDYAKIYKKGGKELAALDNALESIKGKDVLDKLKEERRDFVKDNRELQTARDKVGIKFEHVKEKFADKFGRRSDDKHKSHAEKVKSEQGAGKGGNIGI